VSIQINQVKIIREVNIQAEEFYKDAVDLGIHAAYALKVNHRSQMTGLENIAESAFKYTDIFDYIKRQTARYSYWQQGPERERPGEAFGERLLNYLEKDLSNRRDNVCKRLKIYDMTDEDKQLRRRLYLLLIRQFVRQMVVQYEYRARLLGNQKGA
jgi:hypothetical protein